MKGALLFISIFALSMLVIPMIALSGHDANPAEASQNPAMQMPAEVSSAEDSYLGQAQPALEIPDGPPPAPADTLADADTHGETEPRGEEREPPDLTAAPVAGVEAFRVLDETTGEIHTVSAGDYVRGAVAAEMPAKFHPEALKAQAVAAHTYALYHHYLQQKNPDPALRGADFSGDPGNMKVYITEETARDFYADKADEYWEKICAAADSVADLVLVYQEEPIVAAYHAMSGGVTEDASNVWVGSAPYLAPAYSEGDLLAPDYETEAFFTFAQLEAAFEAAWDIRFPQDTDAWFGAVSRSDSGYVVAIDVGDTTLHGSEVRKALDLRSHNFEIVPTDTGFLFVVYGHGHGVGLSQYGADFMARQGASFDEILANYYTGAVLVSVG